MMEHFAFNVHNWDMILRLLVATVLGGAVGIERGSGDRPAGFRTHILVCVGSALIMLVSMYGFDDTYVSGISNANNRDSARIAAQVVSGIGCLAWTAVIAVVLFIGYWVLNIILYLLPVVVAVGILLGIVYAVGYVVYALLTGR